jgi:ATPase, P-type (transporting), HAD superfamily, subfamily IC
MGVPSRHTPPDSSPATRRSAYHWGPSRGIQTMARLPVPPECLLGSDPRAGLDSAQVAERRRQFGDNDVTEDRHRPLWAVVTASATDPMLWFLLLMGVLFFALGDTTEAIVLLLAIIPLLGMDAWLHRRTQASTEGLASRLASTARVLRDGQWQEAGARELLPGDVVEVVPGDWVPADGLVLFEDQLQVDESSLTGESFPVRKQPIASDGVPPTQADTGQWVHAGTRVLSGEARLWIVHTGANTRYGEIVRLTRASGQARTPLQQAVSHLVRWMLVAALVLCLLLAAVRLVQGHGLVDALVSALTLAVAALPEEYPVVFTLFLGVGVYRLAQRQALVRRAVAVENIGRVSAICSDKTGTLTEGELRLMQCVPAEGIEANAVPGVAALACGGSAHDPMDRAILAAAGTGNGAVHLASFPFTEDRRRETALVERDGQRLAVVKGAPETVRKLCGIDDAEYRHWQQQLDALAAQGLKVIACASRPLAAGHDLAIEPAHGYAMAGLLAFGDPLREGVREAVQTCLEAGIRVVMVTGDHPLTAGAIAGQIGLGGGTPRVLSLDGRQDQALDPDELAAADVIARAAPGQKLQLVQALQARGHTVAVTGDGVNDVPALQTADIGIAMGQRGTRSAREAAAIVLLDDNFRTLAKAIAEGRQLFANLQRGFAYLLLFHAPLVLSAALVPLAGLPLLYLPIHIVWLELLVHPTAMLGFQQQSRAGLQRLPAVHGPVRFFPPRASWTLLLGAAVATAAVLGAYAAGLHWPGEAADTAGSARTLALVTLMLCSLAFLSVLSGLAGRMPRVIAGATLASVALVQVPALSPLLSVRPLGAGALLLAAGLATLTAAAVLPLRRALSAGG